MPLSHRFRLIGRGLHPVVHTAADLKAVGQLDDAYWVSTAAPVNALRGDAVLYKRLDADGDGRIRSDELRAAIAWLFDSVTATDGIEDGNTRLPLAGIRADGPDGAAILDAARKVSGETAIVDLERTRAVLADEVAKGLSASGRVLPAAAGEDVALGAFLNQILAVSGGVDHPSGDRAVARESMDGFLTAANAWIGWVDAGAVGDAEPTAVMPLGAGTGAANAAVEAIAPKMEQYLLLCDAVALDRDLAASAKVDAAGTDLLDPEQATTLLKRAPLAVPRPDGQLDAAGALNPAWRAAVAALFADAVGPLLGEGTTLDRAGWSAIRAKLAPHRDWLGAKPQDAAAEAGIEALRRQVADPSLVERTEELLAASVAGAVAVDGLELLEKLILFQAHLTRFARNMVGMPELMDPEQRALFEHGRLVIDGREFDLAIRVTDAARAEKFGSMSPVFTMFVMVGAKGGTWTDQFAVPVTAGERGHLVEGQWGVFFPVDGGELHAQIRKIASSPISIKEALLAPFRRIEQAIQDAADKSAGAQSASMSASVTAKATAATDAATSSATTAVATGEQAAAAKAATASPAPAPAVPVAPAKAEGGMGGQLPLLAAGAGIALAALASAAAYVAEVIWSGAGTLSSAFLALGFVQALPGSTLAVFQVLALPLALILILGCLLLIPVLIYAIPVSIATWLRLRRRDLASLLEGAGFAINTRLMLERGHATRLARRPAVGAGDIAR